MCDPGIFSRDDFAEMADTWASIKDHFMLSIKDYPDIREIFAKFHQEPVRVRYTIAKDSSIKSGRLVISGSSSLID